MVQEIKLNNDQKAAVEKGKRIGFLIAALNLPDEEKEQILKLLPEMSTSQLGVLLSAMETNYLAHSGRQADNALQQGLTDVAEKYSADMADIQKKALNDLEDLDKRVSSPE